MRFAKLTALIALLSAALCCYANDSTSVVGRITNFPKKFFNRIDTKTASIDNDLGRQTDKYLRKLARQEEKIKKRLAKFDTTAAKNLFVGDPQQQYAAFAKQLKTDSTAGARPMSGEYLAYTDSLKGSLEFLIKNPQLLQSSKVTPADIQNSITQFQQLQAKIQDADQIKQFVQQRRAQIGQYLSQYAHLPSGITNAYNGYKQQAYYYSDQVRRYKEMLNDPDKMMKTVLVLLNKLPAFSEFMRNNSMLAGLFGIPADYGTAQGLVGLQTRDQVMGMIQSQIASGGPNAGAMISQNLQDAHAQLDQFKNKLSGLGGGSADIDMPEFKPNNQKTKTFLQRLEYGTNMQTTHGSYFFPTTTDLGLSVGYKLDNKNTIGIGASYKVGWGSDISHINVSSQGAGLRSFLDLQVKKSFFATGGFEYNYQQPFYSFGTASNLANWQQSGLIGVSKAVSMTTKFFKQTKIQILWDFLSYQQIPKAQPFKFRVGYNF